MNQYKYLSMCIILKIIGIIAVLQVYQDVIQDYAKKTVTIDPHPHLSHQHASIHPCQHATAMLSILEVFIKIFSYYLLAYILAT